MGAQGRLSPAQFVMPLAQVLKMPSAEGWEGHETVEGVLPMKRVENARQLAEGEPFVVDRQTRVRNGTYKALRVSASGQLRDGHHTLAMLQDEGAEYVRLRGGWRPWDGKAEDEPDESWDLTQQARRGEISFRGDV